MVPPIQIRPETKAWLDEAKKHPEETDDEALNRILDEVVDTEPIGEETLVRIEEAIADLRKGRCRPFEEVVQKHGLR
ncbi:hypothetical protein RJ53_02395 [Methanocalculus chunghsingensis]|uniref:Uncharacterized protein n=1 Tax=Methanocalculus chunghsingensis TaxID=156457 RepID=A0A8J8B3N7_9EURY|nr:hypothetical protein [Methanocalculus chunghsingensis]MBR1368410.1 hypothetical protein [Methanocalculus chunghsingensis]